MRQTPRWLVGLGVAFSLAVTAAADDEEILLQFAQKVRLAEQRGDHREVIRLADEMIKAKPAVADLYAIRGDAKLKAGDAAGAVADFDQQIKLNPAARDPHWQRGIAHYYAGQFANGEQQFAWYQNYHAEDVENVVFHFACRAKRLGLEKAREAIFRKPRDRRVPMSEVYDFYLGKITAEEVLAAAKAGEPSKEQLNKRLMYAHLYLGLYYDCTGDEKLAAKHILAADSHQLNSYMWDVAHLHAEKIRAGQGGGDE